MESNRRKVIKNRFLIAGILLFMSVIKTFQTYHEKAEQGKFYPFKRWMLQFLFVYAGLLTISFLMVWVTISSTKLIWKMLVIMTFASIPAALSAWDWYFKEYAHGSHPVRDTMLQFFILFFLITLGLSTVPLYAEYRKRKENNTN